MTRILIDFHGVPVAKGRPRFVQVVPGQRPIAITPAKTRHYETGLRYAAQQEMGGRPLLNGPLSLSIVAALPVPKSWSKRKKQQALDGSLKPTTRPDIDNYIKLVQDALNCVVFADDSQITQVTATKRYSDKPGIYIEVWDWLGEFNAEPASMAVEAA